LSCYTEVKFQDPVGKNKYEIFMNGPLRTGQNATYRAQGSVIQYCTDRTLVEYAGDQEFLPDGPLTLDDNLFAGQLKNLQFYFATYANPAFAVLRNCSNAYYAYRKSSIRHGATQPLKENYSTDLEIGQASIFIGDPIPMYSNVQGGYGILAAYTADTKPIR
jgi:hypothetical protein